jgi:hypothetical protein
MLSVWDLQTAFAVCFLFAWGGYVSCLLLQDLVQRLLIRTAVINTHRKHISSRGKRRRRGGRKEAREGGESGKCLGGRGMGIPALRSATMDSRVPCTRPPAAGSAGTRRCGSAGLQLQRSAPSSARQERARAACAAQPRGRGVRFELAAGPRQLRKLRGAAAPCKSKRAWGEPKRPWV